MSSIDWIVLLATISSIVLYGIFKNRKDKNLEEYLLGNKSLPWYHICFSTMATQASAITFLSAPGQGFSDGMRFVQFYFGLPLAILLISIVFIPIFNKLNVYTAYQYLEDRFDARVRIFTAALFLLSRGLATGLSIYAPSIILSTIFKWDITYTNLLMGSLVLVYTVIGGTKAISHTHVQQMFFVILALFSVGILVITMIPDDIGFLNALKIAGKAGKMNVLDLEFNPKERYNLWSGLIGGFFLQLSYYGTDQSQVGRYLVGKSTDQIKLGLLANGFLKIPMQFVILLIGVLVFIFYIFSPSPLLFNKAEIEKVHKSAYSEEYVALEKKHVLLSEQKKAVSQDLNLALNTNETNAINILSVKLNGLLKEENSLREEAKVITKKSNPKADTNDVNYVFLRFIMDHIPVGLIGFIIAVIFTASMGSVASAYSSLAATSQIDILNKTSFKAKTPEQELRISKYLTVFWGVFCVIIANFSQRIGNSLIELVNILGSWFYGVILGIFLVAFFFKKIKANAVLFASFSAQIIVILIWYKEWVAFLWLNPIGALLVIFFAFIFQLMFDSKNDLQKNINH
jgi:solute carrier family 5 (sodium-dependent multivitamin transporter), member 6